MRMTGCHWRMRSLNQSKVMSRALVVLIIWVVSLGEGGGLDFCDDFFFFFCYPWCLFFFSKYHNVLNH